MRMCYTDSHLTLTLKVKDVYSFHGNPSQSYGASPAIWDHTVLPAARHRWTRPALTTAMQAGTRFTYLRRTQGWVDLGGWLYIQRQFTCLQTVTHPISNHSIATRLRVKPTTSWS